MIGRGRWQDLRPRIFQQSILFLVTAVSSARQGPLKILVTDSGRGKAGELLRLSNELDLRECWI